MGSICSSKGAPETEPREGRVEQPRTEPLENTVSDAPAEDIKEMISVTKVSFNINDDCKAHHTDEYDLTKGNEPFLVIRRGQPFQMKVTCDQPYDKEKHDLKLMFETGPTPVLTKGTSVHVILSDPDKYSLWGAKLLSDEGKNLTLEVITPPYCFIGRWRLKIMTLKKENRKPFQKIYSHPQPIYILFNPWCKEDQVYLHDDDLLEEYVLNETGKIFVGSSTQITGRAWSFGQFDNPVLDCVLDLLDTKGFPAGKRGDPVMIARKLSALVNSSDEGGILTGNWSGNYGGGESPLFWTGSHAILERYYNTKSSVRFGQCWVFSGVLTTCCRVLGIPSRSVTNFSSAHDTDESVTIDYVFDHNSIEVSTGDSVWNFHVWNDAWMGRPDLKEKEYGGWQAIDATPQEKSKGVYQCGPCPLMAIKNGDVNVNYDGRFIFAEVNADVIYWFLNEDETVKKMRVQTENIGKHISTHRPKCRGVNPNTSGPCKDKNWEDVTSEYKYNEGGGAERAAVMTALRSGTAAHFFEQPDEGSKDVSVKVEDKEYENYGDDIVIKLEFENLSKEKRTLNGTMSLRSYYSTGVYAHQVKSEKVSVSLGPEKKETKTMVVKFDEYYPKTIEGCYFKTAAVCTVQETEQIAFQEDAFRLIKPDLDVKVKNETGVKVGQEFTVNFSFTNPLPIKLTNCKLAIEGPGIQKAKTVKQGTLEPKAMFSADIKMTASKPGTRMVIGVFEATEIVDVNGSCEIEVKEK